MWSKNAITVAETLAGCAVIAAAAISGCIVLISGATRIASYFWETGL